MYTMTWKYFNSLKVSKNICLVLKVLNLIPSNFTYRIVTGLCWEVQHMRTPHNKRPDMWRVKADHSRDDVRLTPTNKGAGKIQLVRWKLFELVIIFDTLKTYFLWCGFIRKKRKSMFSACIFWGKKCYTVFSLRITRYLFDVHFFIK